ncbi:MAG: CotH kinase family protein [Bacteroidota bacterium]|nr:CotH kinase family protein [Bacteroidota bacterium]
MKKKYLLIIILAFISLQGFSQIVINEVSNKNLNTIFTEEDEADDWIELYNSGSTSVNMKDWLISDKEKELNKWVFPEVIIPAGKHLLLVASGKDIRTTPVHHWESVIYSYDTWKFFAGTTEPPVDWNKTDFNDTSWPTGYGGLGYGSQDTCLKTTVAFGTTSVYSRGVFNIIDAEKITRAVLHMDFDDGFIAYLNGVEIARKNMNGPKSTYNSLASDWHNPVLYLGEVPDSWYLEQNLVKSLLKPGKNVLSVQVHNVSEFSNDLSSNAFFSIGLSDSDSDYKSLPGWLKLKGGFLHTNFKLSTGEELFLSNSQGNVVDSYIIPPLQLDQSIGRKPDGSANWCFFSSPTPESSNNNSNCYQGYEPVPVFSLNAGFYQADQIVTITTQSPTSVIRYTLNGNVPKSSDPVYSSPLHINKNTVISARCFSTVSNLPSKTVKGTYFINENITLPVFSISTDSMNLWGWETGIYVKGPGASADFPYFGANFWKEWEKEAHIEYFDKDNVRQVAMDAGIKIHGGYSRGFAQKSLRIHCRGSYGTSRINYPLIPDKEDILSYKRIILRNGGQDFYKTRFRDGLMQRLVKDAKLDYMAYEPAVLFVNGAYWGLIGTRERIDKHYLESNNNIDPEKVDILKYHGYMQVKEGSDSGFINMRKFVINGNSQTSEYYEQVNNLLDLENFADFFIVETFYSNVDWLGDGTGNMRMWRSQEPGGRWRYILADLDFGLGLRTGSLPSHNMLAIARDPNDSNVHSDLFNKMLSNVQFKNYFINRYADLMNTMLHIDNIKGIIPEFKIPIEPEIPRHVARWSYGKSDWYNALDHFENFAEERIDFAREHVQSGFGLVKQVEVTLNVVPEGAGQIKISTIIPDSLPWKGIYFDGVPVTITAMPNEWFTFKYWGQNGLLNQDPNAEITLNLSSNETFTAYFDGSVDNKDNINTPFHLTAVPNPAMENMIINIYSPDDNNEMLSFEIYDLTGKSIQTSKCRKNSQIVLNKKDFRSGIYLIKLSNDSSFLTKKIVFN